MIKTSLRRAVAVGSTLAVLAVMACASSAAAGTGLAATPGWWFSTIDGGDNGAGALPSVPLGQAVQNGGYCHSGNNGPTGNAVVDGLQQHWNYWDQCGLSVVSAAAEGIAAPPNGDKVARWDHPKGFSDVYQKLNREFIAPGGSSAAFPVGPHNPIQYTTSPADVSGRYVVNQYIDSAHTDLATGHAWVILQEFKENFTDAQGVGQQYSYYGFGCDDLSGPTVTCSMTGGGHNVTGPRISMASISDRWVTFEYRLYQGAKDTTGHGGRAELWIDGALFDTGYESQLHVGPAGFSPLAQTHSWIWIVGQYTSNQTTNGVPDSDNIAFRSYVDGSQVAPLTPPNTAPVVNAGPDRKVIPSGTASLAGTVTDDGQPSGTTTAAWSTVSGPGTVAFGNASAAATTATFSARGTYVLRLTGSDGTLTSTDDVTVTQLGPGLDAAFFNNTTLSGTPVLSRTDPAINFSWGTASPGAGVNANSFSARWTGYVTVPTTGSYFWCTRTDDGSRVWVNGVQVINGWTNHAATPPTCGAAQSLTAGVPYPLTVEYYDATSTATAAFGYKTTAGGTDVQTPAAWLSR